MIRLLGSTRTRIERGIIFMIILGCGTCEGRHKMVNQAIHPILQTLS